MASQPSLRNLRAAVSLKERALQRLSSRRLIASQLAGSSAVSGTLALSELLGAATFLALATAIGLSIVKNTEENQTKANNGESPKPPFSSSVLFSRVFSSFDRAFGPSPASAGPNDEKQQKTENKIEEKMK